MLCSKGGTSLVPVQEFQKVVGRREALVRSLDVLSRSSSFAIFFNGGLSAQASALVEERGGRKWDITQTCAVQWGEVACCRPPHFGETLYASRRSSKGMPYPPEEGPAPHNISCLPDHFLHIAIIFDTLARLCGDDIRPAVEKGLATPCTYFRGSPRFGSG